jgi:hypothetical protein
VKHRFQVIRTKLEASPSSLGTTSYSSPSLPDSEEEATIFFPSTNYFEFHIRLRLKRHRNVEEEGNRERAENTLKEREERKKLLDLVRPFGGHLSRSAFKLLSEEEEHRFVTLRLYHLGKKSAYEKLEQTLEALRSGGYVIDGTQREYAVMDSNVSLDAGWIEPSTSPYASYCCSYHFSACSYVSSSCSSS